MKNDDYYEIDRLDDIFFGKEIAKMMKKWNEGLDLIENNYLEFFQNRPPLMKSQKHDKPINHVSIMGESHIRPQYFRFTPNSDLPLEIRNEIVELFNNSFLND